MDRNDSYYRALLARDARFDGKFFVGVKTTGIYCRPICPAKPKRENVEFFSSALSAEKKGYRPCLRCRPESAPQSPLWMGKSAMVRRAVRIIHTQPDFSLNEDGFAALLGVSARHLRRVFSEEVGKTPKQLGFENRLNLARKLVSETHLNLSEIAFAAGFTSIRRFNDAFKARFTQSPSRMRRHKTLSKAPLKITLAYRPPFNFSALLKFYRSQQVAHLERFENNKMFRVVCFNNVVGEIAISDDAPRCRLQVEIDFPDSSTIYMLVARVRAMFDLDSDPVLVANALEQTVAIKKILGRHAGIRLPSGWDSFEMAVAAILGQGVAVARAQRRVSDLVEAFGRSSGRSYDGHTIKLFPSPAQIANADLSALKINARRQWALKEFARQVATGELSLEATQDVDEFIQKLLSIAGISLGAAQLMALKILRHTDTFTSSDPVLSRALKIHGEKTLERMRPWRGYAAALFWCEYSGRGD